MRPVDIVDTHADTIPVINPNDVTFYDNLYVMWFGAYGSIKVYVWARCFEDAFEEAAEYAGEHAPGVFTEPDYLDAARDEYAERESIGWEAGDHPTSRYARVRAVYSDGADPFTPYREDIDADAWQEAVQERAETDLTYTESGYVASWEWGGADVTDATEHERVKAACLAACEDDE
jgi:hypothetical protein